MSNNNKNNNKKMRTDEDGFDTLKAYIRECPHLPKDHPAVHAALQALDKEQKRIERDRKLQMKFAGKTSASQQDKLVASEPLSTTHGVSDGQDVVVLQPADTTSDAAPASVPASDSDDMEWQDVAASTKEEKEDGSTLLGKRLAKMAIDSIAEHKKVVQSPLAAILLPLHASLRSQLMGFSCTGVPEPASNSAFAAPVRELPPTQFLPPRWEDANKMQLRYRKRETGAVLLTVQKDDTNQVTVHFHPVNNKEPPLQSLTFALDDHLNMSSWAVASKSSPSISPSLHYKNLPALLSSFIQSFDFGTIHEVDVTGTAMLAESTMEQPSSLPSLEAGARKSDFVSPEPIAVPAAGAPELERTPDWASTVPSTLPQAFPGAHRPAGVGGDFGSDLAPPGLVDPRFLPRDGRMGGNLMGPNHPMFQGGGGLGPFGGPGSMQPRFDPVYPNGVDVDPTSFDPTGRRRPPPSRFGEPNPDHLRPPNAFGRNMFS